MRVMRVAISRGRGLREFGGPTTKCRQLCVMKWMAALLAAQAAGSRPLIFSQWTSTLDILEWLLQQLDLPFLRLDGSTAVAERLSLVDRCATVHLAATPRALQDFAVDTGPCGIVCLMCLLTSDLLFRRCMVRPWSLTASLLIDHGG